MVLHTPWRTPLTQEEDDELFMLSLEDDTEDAPWMVMGDLQFWSASAFAHSLRIYAHEHGLPWYVASMLPINYRWADLPRKRTLSPDTFVAFVPEHARTSYDVEAEGGFPAFVLEVVSPSSVARDEQEKLRAYNLVGAREYALFTPREGAASTLEGYRRGAAGGLEPWPHDGEGGLWSDVLGLRLVVRGALLQAQTPDGRLLLTPEQTAEARQRAEEVSRQAQEARQRAEEVSRQAQEARQRAEQEADHLRQELKRYKTERA